MLRTLAEMENLRKRTSREVADARVYGITGFARDVLEIADNLQRALDAVPPEAKAAADPGLQALIEGVELTERSLLNALEKNGVKKFDPSGEKFDPIACCARRWLPSPRAAPRRRPRQTATSRTAPPSARPSKPTIRAAGFRRVRRGSAERRSTIGRAARCR